jgi:hypothetical protein
MASAAGTRMALLMKEPRATAQTTGSSRSALTPETCWALSARSSPSTPAVFLAATLESSATSSSTVAMSSINASRLLAIRILFVNAAARGRDGQWKGIRRMVLYLWRTEEEPPTLPNFRAGKRKAARGRLLGLRAVQALSARSAAPG